VKHVEAASRLLRPPQLTEDAAEEEDRSEAPVWGEKISHLRHIEDRRKAKAYPRYAYVPQSTFIYCREYLPYHSVPYVP
jgi:hypothetical protein